MSYFYDLLECGVPKTIPNDGFSFEDLFDEYVADNQKTWKHDRAKSVGASEAFACIRKSWFSKVGPKHGYKKDPEYEDSWGAMRRGDLIENYHVVPSVKAGLRRRGMDLILEGEDQDTIVDGNSSATSDGLIINAPKDLLAYYGIPDIKTDCVTLEMKSFDPRINITEAKAVHEGQVQMQMGLIHETTEWRPEYAVVLYVNASWLDDIRCYVVKRDVNYFNIGVARANKVFETDDPATLAAEGKMDGMCVYCPFKKSCDAVSVGRVPEKTKALTKRQVDDQPSHLVQQLEELVRENAELKAIKKRTEKDVEESNEVIKQILIRSNQSRAVGDDWKVSYTTVAGRKTLSKNKIIEAGLDPDDFIEEGTGYEKLTVSTS